jgi:hypothetical protein
LREDFVRQAGPTPGLGVEVIIPAGGYPMLLFAREPDFRVDGAMVLNGLPAAVAAETAVRLRRMNGTGYAGQFMPDGVGVGQITDRR